MNREETEATPQLVKSRHWGKYFKIPTQGTINQLLLNRKENGFSRCVVNINHRLYIDVPACFSWIKERRECNEK